MKKVTKVYCIREKSMFSEVLVFSIPLTFPNCKNSMRELSYSSALYVAPTKAMVTPETSRNRKYQIK